MYTSKNEKTYSVFSFYHTEKGMFCRFFFEVSGLYRDAAYIMAIPK